MVKHFLGFICVLILCEQELELSKVVLGVAEHARYDFRNFFETSAPLTDCFFAKNDDRQNTQASFGSFYESILIGNVKLLTSGVLETRRVTQVDHFESPTYFHGHLDCPQEPGLRLHEGAKFHIRKIFVTTLRIF